MSILVINGCDKYENIILVGAIYCSLINEDGKLCIKSEETLPDNGIYPIDRTYETPVGIYVIIY